MSMYGQCMSSVASSPEPRLNLLHSSICTSRKETRENSHTQLRLACTNPSWAIFLLVCGTQVFIRASNKTCEKTTQVVNLDVSCTVLIEGLGLSLSTVVFNSKDQ